MKRRKRYLKIPLEYTRALHCPCHLRVPLSPSNSGVPHRTTTTTTGSSSVSRARGHHWEGCHWAETLGCCGYTYCCSSNSICKSICCLYIGVNIYIWSRNTSSTSMSPSASADLSSLGGEVTVQDEPEVSRITKWRELKRAGSTVPPGRLRRAYMCKVCKRPETSEGHTQFHGHRYPGRYQRMSGCPLRREEARPRRHWPKRQQQHQRAVDRCSLVLSYTHCLLYIDLFSFM